ncbi:MAG: hypothetical protein ACRDRL_15240, partial [Sciscionella sp.]
MSFRFATANVNKALRGKALTAAIGRVADRADVVCWQEIESDAHVAALRALAGWTTIWPDGHARKSPPNATPLSYRTDLFTVQGEGYAKTVDGIAKVTPSRYDDWFELTEIASGVTFPVVNVHALSGIGKPGKHARWGGLTRML